MMPKMLPQTIQEKCNRFVSDFSRQDAPRLISDLSHTGEWKEDEDMLVKITKKNLKKLENIWRNPAFHREQIASMNEGTYVNGVVVPLIRAALHNNPFGESAFITM